MSELLLTKEFYSEEQINRACLDYKKLADISVDIDSKYYRVFFANCKYSEKLTMDEFENYVIDLMVKK